MIARAESGQARDGMSDSMPPRLRADVGELYEPLADEKGLALRVDAPVAAPMRGNRELVSQALANLVDNAIKYAAPRTAARSTVRSRKSSIRAAGRATASC